MKARKGKGFGGFWSYHPPPRLHCSNLTCMHPPLGTGSSSLCPPTLSPPHLPTPVGSCLDRRAMPAVAVAFDRRLKEGLAPGGNGWGAGFFIHSFCQ